VRSGPIEHRFVTEIPRAVDRNVLYVSIPFATAVHVCPGCDRKVVTPFAPKGWHLVFDGEAVSIDPSIRNRAHECRSHYWLWNDQIVPAFDSPDRPLMVAPELRMDGAGHDTRVAPGSWLRKVLRRVQSGLRGPQHPPAGDQREATASRGSSRRTRQ
jgi:Family of unknown function (DUF6527)